MGFENHNTLQIDYEYRKRDLQTKYSYAISRLGTANESDRQHWRDQLTAINEDLAKLNAEFRDQQ